MSLKTTFFQLLALVSHWPAFRRFSLALGRVEESQREKLRALLSAGALTEYGASLGISGKMTYEEFARTVPLSTYAQIEPWISRQRASPSRPIIAHHCKRFEPTSGSTDLRKWIPYPPGLMREFDAAASAWIFDMTLRQPGILWGAHYWSLSWIPTELRGEVETVDELEVFPFWKKVILSQVMAVPSSVTQLPSMQESLLATVCHLAARRDLSLVSVWSPTFMLQILNTLAENRLALADRLPAEAAALLRSWDGSNDPSFFTRLWPKLKIISAWDSSASAPWARELSRLLPQASLEGKGLWATEGVVTFPFRGKFPLALTSHFYEFRDLETDEILPAWALRKGMQVQPIFSTSGGFYRYQMQDRMLVTEFLGECPCFLFLGRLRGIDLVGEKLDASIAAEALEEVNRLCLGQCLSFLARSEVGQKPRYFILACAPASAAPEIAMAAEKELQKSHHYKVARELGQLGAVEARVFENLLDAQKFYENAISKNSRLAGVGKIDPLSLWQ